MPVILKILLIGLMLLTAAGLFVWLMIRALKRSDDPARLIFKWIITLLVGGALVYVIAMGPGFGSAFVVPFLCVLLGIILSITWAPSLALMLFRPLTSLFDGGFEEVEPQPFYSVARAKRNRGHYHEALWEIQSQLEKFPNDFAGVMLMAEIQAENLNDLQAAALTIRRLCDVPDQPATNVVAALNQLADWHLKYAQDAEAARQSLEEILERLPDTPWAHAANQRIAHLATPEMLLGPHDRRPMAIPHHEDGTGLQAREAAPDSVFEAEAQDLVKHLEEFPLDNEARERLAILYARHYGRLDLATAELEQLIEQPHAPARMTVHWLNLLADLQVEMAQDEEAARATLQRIIDLFPDHSAAELARQRQSHLKLELRKAQSARVVALGTYEQDLGLKRKYAPNLGVRPPRDDWMPGRQED